ncbi:amino acid ABC transporter permease [Mesorhizobium sp. M2C.T.Ca.TU.002.02.1.1]|uniref:amino acid ABC transporter permease n=1 Tax=Mesorhizobium sp. M2C.T.Ca.TU.002.02.1.1 TaxID=2496788 RepID=UPI000FCC6584|nr:amino acid ABC transporter permease [Mesorhizobium sp. M2C.T.Ca.TU.002.02.1.1]RUU60391.1 amino acid ABC transporter permease [Mesorhizobium sp. M2C.T.Ca.TU.002.02.1.1]RUU70394.1 amino acid ABC transporter permease [Mesorhizobium sp. M2C.T.Ca.TU.009.01.2.1]
MQTALQFGPVLAHLDLLQRGLEKTIGLAALSILFGAAFGILGAVGRSFGPRFLSWPIGAYVELIRNTPLLIQLYFVFFSLPLLGFKLSSDAAAVIALSIHLGAYATEILRAGIEAVPEGQIEAAKSLGLSRYRIIRHIVLVPAARAVYPSLSAQFILQIMGTSIVGAIAAEELTAVANNLVMQTFRSFEVYIVIAVVYFVLVQAASLLFAGIGKLMFRWKASP